MIPAIVLAMAFSFLTGTVDVIEGDIMMLELIAPSGETRVEMFSTREFPCEKREGTRFAMTIYPDGRRSFWCSPNK